MEQQTSKANKMGSLTVTDILIPLSIARLFTLASTGHHTQD
ncbi:hypothetical protein CI610_00940 [invertebrate metagenome]|uniref:Uncharacterized protein n=1 Tax=invertebrate metagenome TaxID=1711999 RepID=A0A2H9TA45_9ZZZZ